MSGDETWRCCSSLIMMMSLGCVRGRAKIHKKNSGKEGPVFFHTLIKKYLTLTSYPLGFVGRWPSDGSHQVSTHTLGRPDKGRQCQGKLHHSSFTLHSVFISSS